jgi:hypothetical protein
MTTTFKTRMMIAAAALVVSAGVASAQSMKAEIPFTFRAGDKIMTAGTYLVTPTRHLSGAVSFRVLKTDNENRVLLLALPGEDPKAEWKATGQAVLTFQCVASNCALAGVWTGIDHPAYRFPHPRMDRNEPTHIATVVLEVQKGD